MKLRPFSNEHKPEILPYSDSETFKCTSIFDARFSRYCVKCMNFTYFISFPPMSYFIVTYYSQQLSLIHTSSYFLLSHFALKNLQARH